MHRKVLWALGLVLALSCVAFAQTANKTKIQGMLTTDGITGQKDAKPHGWLEEMVYAESLNKQLGVGMRTASNPQGWFELPGDNKDFTSFKKGRYALFTLAFDGIQSFAIRSDLNINKKGDSLKDIVLNTPAHYSVMYNVNPNEWGKSPYVGGTNFYQTFVATSPHITRIGVKLGDKYGDHKTLVLRYAIYEPNDGPPSTWKRISPIRYRTFGNGVDPIIHIYHVVYRSNEINLTPGKTYAVRFWRDLRSTSGGFALVAHADKGDGYKSGMLYDGDKPMPEWDAYAYVSGGQPGTIVNHIAVVDRELKTYAGAARRFGQTFKASGTSLAGVDTVYADGKTNPSTLPVTFQVYDKPGGKKIGPSRTCNGISLAFQARTAAAWLPGEVSLTPGNMYYIEWTFPVSWNTWLSNEDLPGEAYKDGKAIPGADMVMSVAEYDGTK